MARLRSLKSGIEAAHAERPVANELSDNDQHPAEGVTGHYDRERDLELVESIAGELDDIDAALRRLDDGTYGTCTVCGRPIGAARLDALPATPFCVEHAR